MFAVGVDIAPQEFVAPAEGAAAGFEAVFPPEILGIDAEDLAIAAETIRPAG